MDAFLRFFNLQTHNPAEREQTTAWLREGSRTILPALPAIFVWAVVTAVAMVAAGLPAGYVVVINWLAYAGSAQLAVLSMLVMGANIPLILVTAFVVNLRFVVFSGSTKAFFRPFALRHRLRYGFLTGDVPLILFLNHFKDLPPDPIRGANLHQKSIYIGLAVTNLIVWQVGVLVGVVLASFIPNDWGLSLVASLTLLVLIVKMVDNWAALFGCVAAALTAVFLHDLPNKLWVFCAIVVGVVVAVCAEIFGARFWPKNWPTRIHKKEYLEDT